MSAVIKNEKMENTQHAPTIATVCGENHYIRGGYMSIPRDQQYIKLVQDAISSAFDRYGYTDWYAFRTAESGVLHQLTTAEDYTNQGMHSEAFYICTAVLEAVTDSLREERMNDDIDADIMEWAYTASQVLSEIATQNLDEEMRRCIFDYCTNAFEHNSFAGWDWHTHMLRIASLVLRSDSEYNTFMNLAEQDQSPSHIQETMQDIVYQLLLKRKGETEAQIYLLKHLANPQFRQKALTQALEEEDYSKAKKIALGGIQQEAEEGLGMVTVRHNWRDWLLKIAQAAQNTEDVITYARYLFIHSFNSEQDYYEIVKQHVPKTQWNKYVHGMVDELKKQGGWKAKESIIDIYIKEQWWDELFELVKETPTLDTIDRYEKYLKQDYAQELTELYAHAISRYLEEHMGRTHYKIACTYLKSIIALGNKEKAHELIQTFRHKYPKRRLLMAELDKVFFGTA